MKKRMNYQYYVEGEDEKNLLNVLKRDFQCIQSGKIDKFNVIQERFTALRIRPLKQNTMVVLVYDTDVEEVGILRQNIDFLKKQDAVKGVLCIPQVMNLEDELLRACQIKNVGELTHSRTKKDYKKDLIQCTNLKERLEKHNFDIAKFWSCMPQNDFYPFSNASEEIKLSSRELR